MKIDFTKAVIVEDYHGISGCTKNYFLVSRDEDNYQNIIDSRGNLRLDEWYPKITINEVCGFDDGYIYAVGTVERQDGKKNYIHEDGKILLTDWVDDLTRFQNNGLIAKVSIRDEDGNYRYNFTDVSGKYYLDSWISWAELKHYEKELGFRS